MRKIIISGIILFNLVILMIGGCIFVEDEEEHQYHFEIKIIVDSQFNYTIYAPIVYESGSTSMMEKIESKLKVKQGSGDFEIISTEYGPALKIESNHKIHLVSDYQHSGDYHRLNLSMHKGTINENLDEHWIFCDADELGEFEVYISQTCEAGECCGEIITEKTQPENQIISTNGWQLINIESY